MEAKPIPEFEEYSITKDGIVYNASGGIRRPSLTQNGAVKITLYRDGVPYTKSLSLLVAKTWLWNDHDPEIFNTPIHLDNDIRNVHVDNLKWRPRWFAVKYAKQYWNEEFRFSRTKIMDMDTGEIYVGFLQPCQRYGLLYLDVMKSCVQGTNVFPTWKDFRFA